jgi:hypothetical protein
MSGDDPAPMQVIAQAGSPFSDRSLLMVETPVGQVEGAEAQVGGGQRLAPP